MCFIKEGHKLGKIEPLFKRITEADVKALKEKFGGVQNPAEASVTEAASGKGAKGDKKAPKEKKEKPPKEKKEKTATTEPAPPQGELKQPVEEVKKD